MATGKSKPIVVNFLGIDYAVEAYPDDQRTNKPNWGIVETGQARITIAPSIDDQVKAETLLHEILHLIAHRFEMTLKEADVSRLAAGLLGVTLNGARLVNL